MAIETLQDILTELADQLGVYGAHGEEGHDERHPCRMCFESDLRGRILAAIEIERKLYPMDFWDSLSAGEKRTCHDVVKRIEKAEAVKRG